MWCRLLLLLTLVTPARLHAAVPLQLHVACEGNDAWSGTLATPNAGRTDGPLATLAGARNAIRKLRGPHGTDSGDVTVMVHGGNYVLDQTLELTAADSGSANARVVYQAVPGEVVRFLGGRLVADWRPVTDPQALELLDDSARGHVLQADLKAIGVADYGSPSGGGLELFFAGKPMTLSRWPNDGFTRIVQVLGETEVNVRGTKGRVEGIFQYDGERPRRWLAEKDAWVHGYWFWDWAEQRHPIDTIDVDRHSISVKPPYHGYGYRQGQWFYAFNLLSEIDQPGEWYLDRETGIVYFWPPADVAQSEVMVSVLPTLIAIKDVSRLTLKGFCLEGARGTAITLSGGSDDRVVGCTVRNIGGWAINVSGGTRHDVSGCDMYQMGGGGISLSGGDRTTLTPAGLVAENNHIHDYARINRMYNPGITLQGVGNRASHNLIHDAPHMAIGFGGNDHRIDFNEIHDVCRESNDAGAIYAGRNWTMRGTVIQHNYLHHINGFEGRGCVGVYLDDMYCGTEISGNVFYRVTRAAFIGGGRDCVVSNNLFVDCNPALHIDGRALGWARYHAETWVQEGREKGTHLGIAFGKPPYSERYPQLLTILDDEPFAPKGNRIVHNVSYGGKWDEVYGEARQYQTIQDNLIDVDPRFVTPDVLKGDKQPAATDFALRDDSPAWSVGFEKLPLEEMGLQETEDRARLPVVPAIRH